MLRYQLNDRKALEALAYLIRKPMRDQGNYTKLLKLLYLADRDSLIRTGHPITGDAMFSLPNGPVLSRVMDWVRQTNNHDLYAAHFEAAGKYYIALKRPLEAEHLSRRELEILDALADRFAEYSYSQMIDHVHTLKEWQDPTDDACGRKPIDPAGILLENGYREDDVEIIREELAAVSALDRALSGLE